MEDLAKQGNASDTADAGETESGNDGSEDAAEDPVANLSKEIIKSAADKFIDDMI